jgi:N-acetylneuraminate lyase
MDAKGKLALGIIKRQAELLKSSDISGAFVCGTTGEGPSLTEDERTLVVERWIHAAKKNFPVIVHVGHTSLHVARELAAHAQKAGASAIAAVGPFFYRPSRIGELVDFCAEIASAAPVLPFFYDDNPAYSGVDLPMTTFLEAASSRIPTLAGIKFMRDDPTQFQACRTYDGGRYEILWGVEETLLAGLALGATGAIGCSFNYAAPVFQRLIKAFQSGKMDVARREQLEVVTLIRALKRFGNVRADKAIMQLIGVDCGPTRSPISPLDSEELRLLYMAIHKLDVFAVSPVSPKDKS